MYVQKNVIKHIYSNEKMIRKYSIIYEQPSELIKLPIGHAGFNPAVVV